MCSLFVLWRWDQAQIPWAGFHVAYLLSIVSTLDAGSLLKTHYNPLQRTRTFDTFASTRELLHLFGTNGQTGRRRQGKIIGSPHPFGLSYFIEKACRL
ncbi:hypothetical protein KSC_110400 [Ktedonobacter sp. SOSP1-52]|nr:hypothetical protein KSC_110400 [Ktedonobacter sp. SOSP1-52]